MKIRPHDGNQNQNSWSFRRRFVATFRQLVVNYRENACAAQLTAVHTAYCVTGRAYDRIHFGVILDWLKLKLKLKQLTKKHWGYRFFGPLAIHGHATRHLWTTQDVSIAQWLNVTQPISAQSTRDEMTAVILQRLCHKKRKLNIQLTHFRLEVEGTWQIARARVRANHCKK